MRFCMRLPRRFASRNDGGEVFLLLASGLLLLERPVASLLAMTPMQEATVTSLRAKRSNLGFIRTPGVIYTLFLNGGDGYSYLA